VIRDADLIARAKVFAEDLIASGLPAQLQLALEKADAQALKRS
jgi:hypothetical protein